MLIAWSNIAGVCAPLSENRFSDFGITLLTCQNLGLICQSYQESRFDMSKYKSDMTFDMSFYLGMCFDM